MMTTEKKKEIIAAYGRTPDDTGSPEVQVALLTERINTLTEHLKENSSNGYCLIEGTLSMKKIFLKKVRK